MGTHQLKFSDFKPKLNLGLYRNWQKRFQRHLGWMKVRVSGIEKISENAPGILAPNHINWKDIPLLGGLIQRPVSFAAARQFFDEELCHKFLDQYLARGICNATIKNGIHRFNDFLSKFLVERVTRMGSIPAKVEFNKFSLVDSAKSILQQNKLMCVFPEGTLGTPDKLRRFKLGIAKILYDYYIEFHKSIPTFPIGITGTDKFYHPGMQLGFYVGKPIFIDEFIESSERETLINFVNELRNRVQKLVKIDE